MLYFWQGYLCNVMLRPNILPDMNNTWQRPSCYPLRRHQALEVSSEKKSPVLYTHFWRTLLWEGNTFQQLTESTPLLFNNMYWFGRTKCILALRVNSLYRCLWRPVHSKNVNGCQVCYLDHMQTYYPWRRCAKISGCSLDFFVPEFYVCTTLMVILPFKTNEKCCYLKEYSFSNRFSLWFNSGK